MLKCIIIAEETFMEQHAFQLWIRKAKRGCFLHVDRGIEKIVFLQKMCPDDFAFPFTSAR